MAPPRIPRAALRFLATKGLRTSDHWTDVWAAEHAAAFTAARMTQIDLVRQTHRALRRALASGQTVEDFRKGLQPWLEERGWAPPARGGSVARRLERIYETNMRTSRAAGQWDRAQRTKRALPYLLYELGPSEEHREEHAAWAGTCLHVDHPFWSGRMPPNGWGCKCRVRQVTKAERDRLVAAGEARAKAPAGWRETRDVEVVRGTGEIVAVPTLKGVDAGWDVNPGRGRMAALGPASVDGLEAALRDMAALDAPNDLPGRWARRHLRGLARTREARAAIRGRGQPGARLPIGVLPPTAAEALGSGRLLTLRSTRKRHGGEPLKPDAPAVAQAVLDAARPVRDAAHGPRRWRWDAEVDGRRWRLVAEADGEGRLELVTLHRRR